MEDSYNFTRWSFLLLTQYTFWKDCSGTVLNKFWVLTSAKCVDPRIIGEGTILYYKSGAIGSNDSGKKVKIAGKIHIHPDFITDQISGISVYDIALVRIDNLPGGPNITIHPTGMRPVVS